MSKEQTETVAQGLARQQELGSRQACGAEAVRVDVDKRAAEPGRDCGGEGAGARHSICSSGGQVAESATMADEEGSVDGAAERRAGWATASEDGSSPKTMEKWALDNAPPPIRVRPEGETSEKSSPKELSPPPSPKRMRELSREVNIHELPLSKVFTQSSV